MIFDPDKVSRMNNDQINNELNKRFSEATQKSAVNFDLRSNHVDGLISEKIMENIHNTSLGKLLGIIASLPEIRQEKVDHGKRLLERKEAELDEELDAAMDRILEELLFGA